MVYTSGGGLTEKSRLCLAEAEHVDTAGVGEGEKV